jgi:DNA-binding HxlR family transcriptional regulator
MGRRESYLAASREPVLPKVPFEFCPIRLSLGCLGRKWALLILRDIAFLHDLTFSQILQRNSGLTPRALSIRLSDLQKEGVIERMVDDADNRKVHYRLTRQGRDVVPILTALIQYGIRYHADSVFEDEKPRELDSLYPGKQEFMLGRLEKFAKKQRESANKQSSPISCSGVIEVDNNREAEIGPKYGEGRKTVRHIPDTQEGRNKLRGHFVTDNVL